MKISTFVVVVMLTATALAAQPRVDPPALDVDVRCNTDSGKDCASLRYCKYQMPQQIRDACLRCADDISQTKGILDSEELCFFCDKKKGELGFESYFIGLDEQMRDLMRSCTEEIIRNNY